MANNQQQSKNKRKTILISMGAAMTGVLGYFGWQYWKKKKILNMDASADPIVVPQKTPTPAAARNDNFPLKRGSRGNMVKMLQQALISKHGASILPKYGPDGDFGPELETALKNLGLPKSVDFVTFQSLTQITQATPTGSTGSQAGVPPVMLPPTQGLDAKKVASDIYQAILKRDLGAVIAGLKKLNTTGDYSAVSTAFQAYRVNGVKQTLVNGILNTFKASDQKTQVNAQFIRMGLKYDGSKWALSGVPGLTLITTGPALIWKDQRTPIQVTNRTVLGKEIARRNQHVVFENGGNKFLVKESDVTYLAA